MSGKEGRPPLPPSNPQGVRLLHYILTTVCPKRSDPIYIVSYDTKWVTTSWTNGNIRIRVLIKMYYVLRVLSTF